jgi:hypothetical protein
MSLVVASVATLVLACGTDVDVGGSSDAGDEAIEAGTGQQCEPCAAVSDCQSGDTCGQFAGDAFCARLCPNHNECAIDESCASVATVSGAHVDACTPKSGTCNPAPPPTSDGNVLTHCGSLVGPSVTATCRSCGRFSNDCQPNGCYGGWWCSTVTHYCERPPTTCP